MRLPNWERRLKAALQKHMAMPAEWGVSDCYQLADDCVEAVTGERMHESSLGYKTEAGAAKKLIKRGFANVGEAFAARFEDVPVSLAQRGDLGIIERDGKVYGGVFTAIGFLARGVTSLEPQNLGTIAKAYRVE
jgi:hypothetical protein